ncbi:group 1 truncated hemoglobin [Dendronalium sp. ChiSLP03b]|uniref:group I truncated hemoglobin n=1 Tax=Dendronalium sp. ChiSLP03b TaxID=3075381 RepID=UPI002AD2822C|nr:group 1 truncated hemoglobin [Dendronalium sp. ChiSLP03b]MDZ8209098.1 group 1 truncated hemoglobin [Dendronalium sp. ChiSLP03b]
MSATLYDKIGGQPTIEKVVDDLHKRILADGSVNQFFAKTDMAKQRGHFIAFLSQLLEGPKQYAGRPMDKTHAGMSVQPQHFDAVAKHLSEAMATIGVAADDISAAIARVSNVKGAILNK